MSERLKIATCDAKRPCRGLTTFLAEHAPHGGGFKALQMYDLRDAQAPPRSMYVVRSRGSDRGVVLNFCPFCGTSINERWTKPKAKSAKAKVSA